MTEHAGAIEYDLLTKTGHELRDAGRTLTWGALASFLLHVDSDSALAREMNGDYSVWMSTLKTNGILADIHDVLSQINANLVAIASHEKSKPVKPYPRPGAEEAQDRSHRIGKGALPKKEFTKWLAKKRARHNGGND